MDPNRKQWADDLQDPFDDAAKQEASRQRRIEEAVALLEQNQKLTMK
jgi:hypothetical protein